MAVYIGRVRAIRIALMVLVLAGCSATVADLRRAETAYDDARYDAARTWLVDLESRVGSMPSASNAQYFYLRGMTEYRLGRRLPALHYLAVARELVDDRGAPLRSEQFGLLTQTLAELTPATATHLPPSVETL